MFSGPAIQWNQYGYSMMLVDMGTQRWRSLTRSWYGKTYNSSCRPENNEITTATLKFSRSSNSVLLLQELSNAMWGRRRWYDPNQNWQSWWYAGHYHPRQIWNQTIHNCDFDKRLKFTNLALHWPSPPKTAKSCRAACDTLVSLT